MHLCAPVCTYTTPYSYAAMQPAPHVGPTVHESGKLFQFASRNKSSAIRLHRPGPVKKILQSTREMIYATDPTVSGRKTGPIRWRPPAVLALEFADAISKQRTLVLAPLLRRSPLMLLSRCYINGLWTRSQLRRRPGRRHREISSQETDKEDREHGNPERNRLYVAEKRRAALC